MHNSAESEKEDNVVQETESSGQECHMLRLPPEILTQIFAELPVISILRLAGTCKFLLDISK